MFRKYGLIELVSVHSSLHYNSLVIMSCFCVLKHYLFMKVSFFSPCAMCIEKYSAAILKVQKQPNVLRCAILVLSLHFELFGKARGQKFEI